MKFDVSQHNLNDFDLGVGVSMSGQASLYAIEPEEALAVVLLHFDSPLQASFALAEWQRQLAPHLPTQEPF